MTCYLPGYKLEDVYGLNEQEVSRYMEVIRSTAHLIMEFADEGGFENASGFKGKSILTFDKDLDHKRRQNTAGK